MVTANQFQNRSTRDWLCTLAVCAATSALPLAGTFGAPTAARLISGAPRHASGPSALLGNDGNVYLAVSRNGYSYQPSDQSNIAFCPAFPLTARALSWLADLRPETALVFVANLSLAAASLLLARYVAAGASPNLARSSALLCLIWPTSFFFRMAYSESLFLLLAVLAMYGMRAGWPRTIVATVIGCATAARPVGVALLAPFVWTLWNDAQVRLDGQTARDNRTALPIELVRAGALVVLSVWGLAAFVGYQSFVFSEPFAFVKAQNYWATRQAGGLTAELGSLVSFSAIGDVYQPGSAAYWRRFDKDLPAWLSLQFANPLYFLASGGLVAWGWLRGWLDDRETLLGALLLLVPYVTHGYESAMAAHGRYAAIVFPAHIALANALRGVPRYARWAVCGVSAAVMMIYSALFAAGYRLV